MMNDDDEHATIWSMYSYISKPWVLGILTVDNLFSINLFMGMESASSSSSVLLLLIHRILQANLKIWSTKEFVSKLQTRNVMASVGVQANILDIDDD